MARRRVGLPADIRTELPMRANMGIGLDPDYPTTVGNIERTAKDASRHKPSHDMVEFVRSVAAFLQAHDATQVRILQDFRDLNHPGDLLVAWSNGPNVVAVAEKFAVSTAPDGTPRLPSWLALRSDNDFDLRWQPAF